MISKPCPKVHGFKAFTRKQFERFRCFCVIAVTYFVRWDLDTIIPCNAAIFIQHNETSWSREATTQNKVVTAKANVAFLCIFTNLSSGDFASKTIRFLKLHGYLRLHGTRNRIVLKRSPTIRFRIENLLLQMKPCPRKRGLKILFINSWHFL